MVIGGMNMAQYKPWRDKAWLYDRYVTRRMTIDQIAKECCDSGISCTPMTIYNNLKALGIPIRGGSRNLGKRTVGGGKGKGFYG